MLQENYKVNIVAIVNWENEKAKLPASTSVTSKKLGKDWTQAIFDLAKP
jgi:hypothetical protein